MKLKIVLPLLLAISHVSGLLQAAEQPMTLAVLPFTSTDPHNQGPAEEATAAIEAALSNSAQLWLIERQSLESILEEQGLGLSAATSSPAAVGSLLGANLLVIGKVTPSSDGEGATITGKIMSVDTGRVFLARSKANDQDGIERAGREIANTLSKKALSNRNQMIAKQVSPEERLAALRKKLNGKTLATITVDIPEVHISRTIPDPAAETELKRVLADCGFKLLNPNSGETPDYQIKGEGFSEFAMRRGVMVACRARVEVKVIPSNSSKSEIVDRETTSAIDVAENVAAKSALQEAGFILAERLAPKMAQ